MAECDGSVLPGYRNILPGWHVFALLTYLFDLCGTIGGIGRKNCDTSLENVSWLYAVFVVKLGIMY